MMSMGSGGSRRRSIEPRFIFAALATLVLVPFVIADLTGGDGDDSSVSTEAEPSDGDAESADGPDAASDDDAVAVTDDEATSFELDPEWLGRGMSRYGESDEATAARIERWSKLSAGESVADLPAIDDVTPPPAKESTETDNSEGADPTPTTSPPVATSPPATAAPSTSPPQTAPPTTAVPTTTTPPATTTTKAAPTTTVAPPVDG